MEVDEAPKSILISIPTKGDIRAETVGFVVNSIKSAGSFGIRVGLQLNVSPFPIDHLRNKQVEGFLETDYDYLFLVDSDTEPPVDSIPKLLAHDKDIAAAVCPGIIDGEIVYTAGLRDPDAKGPHRFQMPMLKSEDLPEGLVEVDVVGATGVLIKRHVLETMKYPWFKVLYTQDGKEIDSGEDFFFCAKAQKTGFQIYADFDIIQRHYKIVPLNDCLSGRIS